MILLRTTFDRVKEIYKEKLPKLVGMIGNVKGSILNKMDSKFLKRYFIGDDEERCAQNFSNHKYEHVLKEKERETIETKEN
ncbi:hypothetical protein COC65_13135 [Bacillus thuringiensis]|uniref:hypothetical protein n=1 Tax=Bacillus thuringiensis TaxID=1428 RepID=UPI000BFB6B14|nr:hypothetical protein [Bacillus thuringiensis]PGS43985.1 hypothetical protein COC65_13135 [Bacillus thuringiensis]